MRTLILICSLLLAIPAHGQNRKLMLSARNAEVSSGGGGGPTTNAPTLYSVKAIAWTAANQHPGITNAGVGAHPRLHLLCVDHYSGGPITGVTNDLGVAGILVTNSGWDGGPALDRVYYWSDSAMQWAVVNLTGTASEGTISLMQFTNSATNGTIIGQAAVSQNSTPGVKVTNTVTSSTTSLVVSYGVASDSGAGTTATNGAGMTTLVATNCGLASHNSIVTSTTGAASVSDWQSWAVIDGSSFITFSIKGWP